MTDQHFKALAVAIATIEDFGERERIAQLIGTVCDSVNKNFNWLTWNETCLVLMDDFGDDYDWVEDDQEEEEDDYDYEYGDYDYDEAWGDDHQEEKS